MIFLLALACAHAPAVTPPAAAPPELPATEREMSHPGSIAFVDLATGATTLRSATEVPEAVAWCTTGGERVPVVRVESSDRGGAREIKRFGPDGSLLDVTMSRPPPSAP